MFTIHVLHIPAQRQFEVHIEGTHQKATSRWCYGADWDTRGTQGAVSRDFAACRAITYATHQADRLGTTDVRIHPAQE